MGVTLTTNGLAKLADKALRRATFMSEGMRPVLEEMARDAVQQMQANVRSGKFKPLAPGYEKEREEHGFSGPPLNRTGAFLRSMYPAVARRPDHWAIQVGFSGEHGNGLSNAALANIQRFGTRGSKVHLRSLRHQRAFFRKQGAKGDVARVSQAIGGARAGIPARPFLSLSSSWRASWRQKLRAHLDTI